MSNVQWTDSQLKAIEKSDCGIVVSAAAGSGKTTVLIERLSRLLLDEKNKIPAHNLLAVTFTNKAAAQMRTKLNNAIDKELVRCFSSPEERESEKSSWLLEQKNDLQFAKVSTINSFCLEFVKDNISFFEFQSGLKILDETTEQMLFDKALFTAVEELCEKEPDSYGKLYNAFDDLSGKLGDVLRDVYVFIRTIPFREQWIEQAKALYTDPELVDKAVEDYFGDKKERLDKLKPKYNALEVLKEKIIPYIKQAESFCLSLIKAVERIGEQLSDATDGFESKDLDKYRSSLGSRARKPSYSSNKEIRKLDLGEQMMLADMCSEASSIVADINSELAKLEKEGLLSEQRVRDNLREVSELFDIIISVVQRTEQIMYEAKLERNAVDFSDVETMTKDLLVELKDGSIVRTPLCEDIRKSGVYRLITIDEFQDVNNLQELIFRAVETDVVISRALRDNGDFNIVIPDDTVHDFIQGTVATDRVKADVLPCLLRLLCLLVAEPCGVAFASRVVDLIIDAGFFRCRNDTFFDDIDFLILPGVRVLQKIMLHTFSSKNSGFHACTRKPDIIHF